METIKGNVIKIKEFKLDGNWAEVAWAQYVTTTKEVEVDGEVNVEESVEEIVIHCESFSGHPEHITMLVDRATEFGTSLDEYNELIEELASTYVALTQEELDEAERIQKVQEARVYLSLTDYKMTVDYFGGLTQEAKEDLVVKRAEAREFIRSNSGVK